jgi:hypothetical protein
VSSPAPAAPGPAADAAEPEAAEPEEPAGTPVSEEAAAGKKPCEQCGEPMEGEKIVRSKVPPDPPPPTAAPPENPRNKPSVAPPVARSLLTRARPRPAAHGQGVLRSGVRPGVGQGPAEPAPVQDSAVAGEGLSGAAVCPFPGTGACGVCYGYTQQCICRIRIAASYFTCSAEQVTCMVVVYTVPN